MEHTEHHVHFSEDTDEAGHTMIVVKEKGPVSYEAHVGFLQIYHIYRIEVVIPIKCCVSKTLNGSSRSDPAADNHEAGASNSDSSSAKDASEALQDTVDSTKIGLEDKTGSAVSGNACSSYQIDDKVPKSICIRSLEMQVTEKGLKLLIEFFAHKEKLLKEKVFLLAPDGSSIQLMIFARVLGKGKGTPMLREGIKLVGVEMEDETEASDWQGFD